MRVRPIARNELPAGIQQKPAPERIDEFKRLLDALTGDKTIAIIPRDHEAITAWVESVLKASQLLGVSIMCGTNEKGVLLVWRRDARKPDVPESVQRFTPESLMMAVLGSKSRAQLVQSLTEARRSKKRRKGLRKKP